MQSELTWDKAVDSVITTPQSEWTPYQIAVANLNPELKSKNKKYQSAFNALNVLENERVNLWQAWQIMMNAYKEAIDRTEEAAERQMNANSVAANIQAWWAISWSAWLSTNPAAAAQQRIAIQNQVNAQNAQIRSNADQNIANIYNNVAQAPSALASMAATNAQIDTNALQTEANANLANAQANYYNKQVTSSWSGWSSSKWTTTTTTTKEEPEEDETITNLRKALEKNWISWFDLSKVWKVSQPGSDIWLVTYDWKEYKDPELNDAIQKYLANQSASVNQ